LKYSAETENENSVCYGYHHTFEVIGDGSDAPIV